ncbi:MAG TPA: DUF4124 domain-containing protein [Steroidobacteraceae bacterium]|jgi:hypothetical protein|nr:DUF4124 domain-containing protein [Steroidobacteraceae bacterium]
MHPRILCFVLGALAAFAASATVVYKWVDADGLVHYSDQAVPGAEKIYTSSSARSGTVVPLAASPNQAAKKPPAPGALEFTQFAITSPAADQTFFGDEMIGVHLALAPGLKPNQIITWHLNGKQLSDQPPDATSFVIPRLDRGAYAIAATITDQSTGESLSTGSVSFYVRQPSELSPQHKNP